MNRLYIISLAACVILIASSSIFYISHQRKERSYRYSLIAIEQGEWKTAINELSMINGYKDSSSKLAYAREMLEKEEIESLYISANTEIAKKNWVPALSALKQLGQYKDSEKLLTYANTMNDQEVKDKMYTSAVIALREKKWAQSISLFQQLGEYKDARDKLSYATRMNDESIRIAKRAEAIRQQKEKKEKEKQAREADVYARQHDKNMAGTENSWGYKLASLDRDYSPAGSTTIRRYEYLLERLATRYDCRQERICDYCVTGRKLLREKYGVEKKCLTLLEDANYLDPSGSLKPEEVFAAVAVSYAR
jgi:hypothetical protein